MDDIRIGLATEDDLDDIFQVGQHAWKVSHAHKYSPDFLDRLVIRAFMPSVMGQALENEDTVVYVAREGCRVVGFIQLDVGRDGTASISYLYVAPGLQGRGIGSKLLEAGLKALAERGVRQVYAVTEADNYQAQRFGERHRFRQVEGDTEKHLTWGEPALLEFVRDV